MWQEELPSYCAGFSSSLPSSAIFLFGVNPWAAVDEDPRRSVTGSALILRDVVVSDTAIYQCEAANVHGSILQNINLFVVGGNASHSAVCKITVMLQNVWMSLVLSCRAPASDPVF